jgi:hypothetical protein
MAKAIIQLIIVMAILYGCIFRSPGETLAYVLFAAAFLLVMGTFRIFGDAFKDITRYGDED